MAIQTRTADEHRLSLFCRKKIAAGVMRRAPGAGSQHLRRVCHRSYGWHLARRVQDGVSPHRQHRSRLRGKRIPNSEAEVVDLAGDSFPRRCHTEEASILVPGRRYTVERNVAGERQLRFQRFCSGKPADADSGRDIIDADDRVLARGKERHVELQTHHDLVVGCAREGLALVHHLHLVGDVPDVLRAQFLTVRVEECDVSEGQCCSGGLSVRGFVEGLSRCHHWACCNSHRLKVVCLCTVRVVQLEGNDVELPCHQGCIRYFHCETPCGFPPESTMLIARGVARVCDHGHVSAVDCAVACFVVPCAVGTIDFADVPQVRANGAIPIRSIRVWRRPYRVCAKYDSSLTVTCLVQVHPIIVRCFEVRTQARNRHRMITICRQKWHVAAKADSNDVVVVARVWAALPDQPCVE